MHDPANSNILLAYLDLRFSSFKDQIMSELSDKIAEVKASQDEVAQTQDEAIARVVEDVAAQQAKIDAQQVQIDELLANATRPEDIEALEGMKAANVAMKAKNAALDPIKPDTLPEDEAPAE